MKTATLTALVFLISVVCYAQPDISTEFPTHFNLDSLTASQRNATGNRTVPFDGVIVKYPADSNDEIEHDTYLFDDSDNSLRPYTLDNGTTIFDVGFYLDPADMQWKISCVGDFHNRCLDLCFPNVCETIEFSYGNSVTTVGGIIITQMTQVQFDALIPFLVAIGLGDSWMLLPESYSIMVGQ